MELDFRKAPEILGDIVDAMAIGVFTVDAGGRFVAWSQGAEGITGFSRDDVIGRPCGILEGENCKGFATLAEMLSNDAVCIDGVCSQECKIMSKEGREIYLHGNVRILRNASGETVGAVGTFIDMTSTFLANEKINVLEKQIAAEHKFGRLIGRSSTMKETFRRLQLAADSDVTVLVTGESGTGKELAAAAIHANSIRKEQPFLAVNCSAIPEGLLESELFGHAKGAFTGATSDKLGVFEVANGGTLFLDEIGDVSAATQVKLLRVLQEGEIRRVGEGRARKVDIRLVTATHQNLRQFVQSGKIREDFYYRINVFEIHMPPLRDRKEDIPLLVDHFVKSICERTDSNIDGVTRDVLDVMMDYHWPGNVRQLQNAVEHACVVAAGDRISYFDLPREVRGQVEECENAAQLDEQEQAERERIVDALRQTNGNRTKAALMLGTSRVTLWKKINRYAIEIADGRST